MTSPSATSLSSSRSKLIHLKSALQALGRRLKSSGTCMMVLRLQALGLELESNVVLIVMAVICLVWL
jgi:hypothetical protein